MNTSRGGGAFLVRRFNIVLPLSYHISPPSHLLLLCVGLDCRVVLSNICSIIFLSAEIVGQLLTDVTCVCVKLLFQWNTTHRVLAS